MPRRRTFRYSETRPTTKSTNEVEKAGDDQILRIDVDELKENIGKM